MMKTQFTLRGLLCTLCLLALPALADVTLPFTTTTVSGDNFTPGTVFYRIDFPKKGTCYLSTASTHLDSNGFKPGTKDDTETGWWAVSGSIDDGFSFFNRATGTGYRMTVTSNNHVDMQEVGYTPTEGSDTTYTSFDLYTKSDVNPCKWAEEGCWCVKGHSSANAFVCIDGGAQNNKDHLAIWRDIRAVYGWTGSAANIKGDAGSSFHFEAAAMEVALTLNYESGAASTTMQVALPIGFDLANIGDYLPHGCVVTQAPTGTIAVGGASSFTVTVKDYTTYYSHEESSAVTSSGYNRYPADFTLTGNKGTNQNVSWATGTDFIRFNDQTETTVIEVLAGETLTTAVNYRNTDGTVNKWMHAYVYVDADDNGFKVESTEDADLVAFNYYNGASSTATSGASDHGDLTTPAFTAPTTAGEYRMRVKVDWDCIDPKGNSSEKNAFEANGGGIIDVTLKVLEGYDYATFNYTDEMSNTFSVTKRFTIAEDLNETVALEYYTLNSVTPDTYTEGTTSYAVSVKNAFPFQVSKAPTEVDGTLTFEDKSTNWYVLNTAVKYNANGSVNIPAYYVYYQAEGNNTDNEWARTNSQVRQLNEDFLWSFVKVDGTQNLFQVYNLTAGASKPLEVQGSADWATFKTDANNVKQIRVLKSGDNFIMQAPDNANKNLGRHKSSSGTDDHSYLGFWNDARSAADAGSQFNITPVDDLCDFNEDQAYATDEYVGSYTGTSGDAVSEAYQTYLNAKTLTSLQTLIEKAAALTDDSRVQIDENKVYQLISWNDANNKGKVVYAAPSVTVAGAADGGLNIQIANNPATAQSLVKFTNSAGTYKIQHVNSGFYFPDLDTFENLNALTLSATDPGTGKYYQLNNERTYVNVWSLHCSTSTTKYFHAGTGTANTICRTDDPGTNDGIPWLIKEVKEIPVTVSAAKWATLCLPVKVVVPEDATCEVYYAPSADIQGGKLYLTKIDAKTVLAAGTPVLICSTSTNDSDVYNFAISTDATVTADALEGNALSGTTARLTGLTAETYYGLAQMDDKVAFYLSSLTAVPANKAYYQPAADEEEVTPESARALVFTTDGDEVTAITPLVPADEAQRETYYDLQGRPVLYPAGGVYVTTTGKKVFIK